MDDIQATPPASGGAINDDVRIACCSLSLAVVVFKRCNVNVAVNLFNAELEDLASANGEDPRAILEDSARVIEENPLKDKIRYAEGLVSNAIDRLEKVDENKMKSLELAKRLYYGRRYDAHGPPDDKPSDTGPQRISGMPLALPPRPR